MNRVFSGRVSGIRYREEEKDFYILQMKLDEDPNLLISDIPKHAVTLKGNIYGLTVEVGSSFSFEGKWVNHAKYGRQLEIIKAPILQNSSGEWDISYIRMMLVNHGVSQYVCDEIYDEYGEDQFLEAISNVDMLKALPGLTDFEAEYIISQWQRVRAYYQTLEFLRDLQISKSRIQKIWEKFGDESEKVLSTNPWALVEVDSFTFEHGDEIANRLGLDLNTPDRYRAAIYYFSRLPRTEGHLYVEEYSLYKEVSKRVPVKYDDFQIYLAELQNLNKVVVDNATNSNLVAVYDPSFYKLEEDSAFLLADRMKTADYAGESWYYDAFSLVGPETKLAVEQKLPLEEVVGKALDEWEGRSNFALTQDQRLGVIHALTQPVSILTGLPGTGKTTTLRAAVRILLDMELPILLVAPTGIASKRIAECTNYPASTIHRAFGASLGERSESKKKTSYAGVIETRDSGILDSGLNDAWAKEVEPHTAKVVFVDESSMLDQNLLYRILACTEEGCRLVFIGDADQLPSVGPGNVLREMISSSKFPTANLTEIFRQKNTSGIVLASHAIHRGEVPETNSDFNLLQIGSTAKIVETILKLAQKLYQERRNFQVLSPRHKGDLGVTNLNIKLREILNPSVPGVSEVSIGDYRIRENDRIMIVKNDYDLGIFNGDLGKINKIFPKLRTVRLKIFNGTRPLFVDLPFKKVKEYVRMSYCCTVHKFQGLQLDFIIMPLVDGFGFQLQRNLLYTGITRAVKKVCLLGTQTALSRAVYNTKERNRNSLFYLRLGKYFGETREN